MSSKVMGRFADVCAKPFVLANAAINRSARSAAQPAEIFVICIFRIARPASSCPGYCRPAALSIRNTMVIKPDGNHAQQSSREWAM
jgi:hypothetical protein